MPNKRAVYIPYYDSSVGKLFKEHGYSVTTSLLDNPSLICFTGGEDVGPDLYGHAVHQSTFTNPLRDTEEVAVFNEAKAAGLPMVGICRGGQFLNVMNGGTMYQDVTNHTGGHDAIIDGERLFVTSTHHQMMNPGKNAIIVGVAVGTAAERTLYDPKDNAFVTYPHQKGELDIEVVAYGNHICFQPHPEYALFRETVVPLAEKFFKLIDKYCFKGEVYSSKVA